MKNRRSDAFHSPQKNQYKMKPLLWDPHWFNADPDQACLGQCGDYQKL